MTVNGSDLERWVHEMRLSHEEANKNIDIFFVVTVSMIIFCKYIIYI